MNIGRGANKYGGGYLKIYAALPLLVALLLIPGSAAFGGLGIERVSTDSSGSQVTGGWAGSPSISSDGRYVAFHSESGILIADDTNGASDIFVKDTFTGSVTRVSTDSSDAQATGGSSQFPSISSDGRYVAFESNATNLVAGDTNTFTDIFVKDTLTGSITRESIDSSGAQANGSSNNPSLSPDGNYVAFSSDAENLVANDTNNAVDVFVVGSGGSGGTVTRVSTDSSGAQATGGPSENPSISSFGQYVTFESRATNLVPGDTNVGDIFVMETFRRIITKVSTDSSGAQAIGPSHDPSISSDGRYVTFSSGAENLVADDSNTFDDIFVKDNLTGSITRVSTDSSGAQATGGQSQFPSISSDGRYVTFSSGAENLVADDSNTFDDIFVKDNLTGSITRVSTASSGVQADSFSFAPSISSNGRYVSFESSATNLVAGDTNNVGDIFRVVVSTSGSVGVAARMHQETQSLTFSITAGTTPDGGAVTNNSVDYGTILSGVAKIGSQTLDVSTNAIDGYSVYASEDGPLTEPGGVVLSDTSSDSGNASELLSGAWNLASTYGYGFTLTNEAGSPDAAFTSATGYRQFADQSIGELAQPIMSNAAAVTNSQVAVWYKVNADPNQQAGAYSNTITYTATGNF